MARKSYTITMTFTSDCRPGWKGKLEQTIWAKSQVQSVIDHYRGWLKVKGHTEVSVTITEA